MTENGKIFLICSHVHFISTKHNLYIKKKKKNQPIQYGLNYKQYKFYITELFLLI